MNATAFAGIKAIREESNSSNHKLQVASKERPRARSTTWKAGGGRVEREVRDSNVAS